MPNYFTFAGDFYPSAYSSFFPLVDKYSDCISKIVMKMQILVALLTKDD
jgi:hypothetical protein